MLKFISFGSGSSGNCYLLATPTDALLIDIGVGLRGLKKSRRPPPYPRTEDAERRVRGEAQGLRRHSPPL